MRKDRVARSRRGTNGDIGARGLVTAHVALCVGISKNPRYNAQEVIEIAIGCFQLGLSFLQRVVLQRVISVPRKASRPRMMHGEIADFMPCRNCVHPCPPILADRGGGDVECHSNPVLVEPQDSRMPSREASIMECQTESTFSCSGPDEGYDLRSPATYP